MYLLDTNVVSEVRKRDGDPAVQRWFDDTDGSSLHLSVLVVGEIQRGILQVRDRDAGFARSLAAWLDRLLAQFTGRLLPIDADVARLWGQVTSVRSVPVIDGLLAATALRHEMTLVTRNTADLDGLGVDLLNPFTPA